MATSKREGILTRIADQAQRGNLLNRAGSDGGQQDALQQDDEAWAA